MRPQTGQKRRRTTNRNACTIPEDDDRNDPPQRQLSIRSYFQQITTQKTTTGSAAASAVQQRQQRQERVTSHQQQQQQEATLRSPLQQQPSRPNQPQQEPAASSSSNHPCHTTTTTRTNHHNHKSSTRTTTTTVYQQMYLDLGQHDFAKRIVCPLCGMIYVHGVAEDLRQHEKVCKDYRQGVPFDHPQARVVTTISPTACIVEIRPSDSYVLRKKVAQVQRIVVQDLGFTAQNSTESLVAVEPLRTVYLYIVKKRVVGMAAAQVIHHAYPLLGWNNNSPMPDDSSTSTTSQQQECFECSSDPCKAMLGIYQLWVHSKFRQQGVATRLVTAAREKLVFGLVVPAHQTAFSSPTQAGIAFCRRYLQATAGDSCCFPVLVYNEMDCLRQE